MQEYKSQDYQEVYRQAKKRVEARLGFIAHSVVWFLIIVLAFIASDRYGYLHGDAFVFLAGWTFGLVMHFLAVRQYFTRLNFPKFKHNQRKSLVERLIEQELKVQGLSEKQIQGQWPEPR
jgi:hypothetical protein